MINKKHKTVCTALTYFEHFILGSNTGCVSISAFTSLFGIPINITSSAIGLKICAIAAAIKKYIVQYNEMKKEMKNLKTSSVYQRFRSIYIIMLLNYCL